MDTTDLLAAPPAPDRTLRVLRRVGAELGLSRCWVYQRRFHFSLGDGWTIALSPESAGRFRIEVCRWTRPVDTLWALARDDDRLMGLVADFAGGVREGV